MITRSGISKRLWHGGAVALWLIGQACASETPAPPPPSYILPNQGVTNLPPNAQPIGPVMSAGTAGMVATPGPASDYYPEGPAMPDPGFTPIEQGLDPSMFPSASDTLALFQLSDPERNTVQAGNVCERLATLQCAGEAHCCEQPGRDFAACKAETVNTCRNSAYLDQMTADMNTGFDPLLTSQRLLEFEQKASTCDISVSAWGETVEGLRGIMQGTIAVNGSCAPRALSVQGAAAALAYCQDPAQTACMPDAAFITWTCTARAAAGGACLTDLNCQSGLFCPQDNPLMPKRSACEARRTDGQPCNASNACASLACKGGMCVPASVQSTFCLQE